MALAEEPAVKLMRYARWLPIILLGIIVLLIPLAGRMAEDGARPARRKGKKSAPLTDVAPSSSYGWMDSSAEQNSGERAPVFHRAEENAISRGVDLSQPLQWTQPLAVPPVNPEFPDMSPPPPEQDLWRGRQPVERE